MTNGLNDDGTIDVRVVLTLRVDPINWATDMMARAPMDVLQTAIRNDVKREIRDRVRKLDEQPCRFSSAPIPISRVEAQGVYDQ